MNNGVFNSETVEKIKALLEESITRKITFDDIACQVCVSRYYMSHMFKQYTGMTLVEYKNMLQLKKAKALLGDTDLMITSIAIMCGYKHAAYFSARFKELEGMTPLEFRELNCYGKRNTEVK